MKMRTNLGRSTITLFTIGITALAVTACGDDDVAPPAAASDAGDLSTGTDSLVSSDTQSSTGPIVIGETSSEETSTASISAPVSGDDTNVVSPEAGAPASSSDDNTSTLPVDPGETTSPADTTEIIEPCSIPSFSVFTRSDTDADWDDNDFSSVSVDASNCPPAVYVDVTWPHEDGWENADPSEANHEQVHFTLDSYAASNLVDKEVTATVELVADARGPNANAGGYLVSIVSVSTYDNITIVPPVIEPDAGSDAAIPEPETIIQTGYKEAESDPKDRILLRRVGDRATISFRVPAKTEAADSFDPARVLKTNLRFYNVYEGPVVEPEPGDAGASVFADAGADASLAALLPEPPVNGDPSLVYDYLTSRFAITKFTITDVE